LNIKNLIALIFLFIFILSCNTKEQGHAQSQYSDSVSYYLKIADNDRISKEKRLNYNFKALKLICKQNNDSINRLNLFKIANRFYNIESLENYKKITVQIVNKAKEKNDSLSLVKAYIYLQDYYARKFMSDSSYYYNRKIQQIYFRRNDINNLVTSILNKAILQHNEGDFQGCERSIFQMLSIKEGDNNYEILYQANNLLGIIYGELNEYELSKKHYNKALEIISKNKFPKQTQFTATTLNNLGFLYMSQDHNKAAIQKYLLGLKQKNVFKDRPYIYALLIDNLAYAKFKINDNTDLPFLFYRSLKIRDSLVITPGIITSKIHLSQYYTSKKDTTTALKFAKEAYDLGIQNNLKRDVLQSLQQLSKIDKKNSASYSSEYYRINDSLQLAERKIRNKFARIEFETEELKIEKNKLSAEKTNMLYISEIMILFIIIIFIWGSHINRKKELEFSKKQQKSNEEIYELMLEQQKKIEEGKQVEKKRISQELHDGVMGKLTSIRLNLFILSKKKDTETIEKCLSHINEIQDIEKEIRNIAYDLGKNAFSDNVNFTSIVRNLFTSIESSTGMSFKFNFDDTIRWDLIGDNIKMQIYRILQEALQNINKHANAYNVSLTIKTLHNSIIIKIEDDGIGFEEQKIKKGFGLKNMISRASDINSTIELNSKPGIGTRIKLAIPLDLLNYNTLN